MHMGEDKVGEATVTVTVVSTVTGAVMMIARAGSKGGRLAAAVVLLVVWSRRGRGGAHVWVQESRCRLVRVRARARVRVPHGI
jgi:hypothetical protein